MERPAHKWLEGKHRKQLAPEQHADAMKLIQDADPTIEPHFGGDLLSLIDARTGRMLSALFFDGWGLHGAGTVQQLREPVREAAAAMNRTPAQELFYHARDYLAKHYPEQRQNGMQIEPNCMGHRLIQYAEENSAETRKIGEGYRYVNLHGLRGKTKAQATWRELTP